MTLLQSFLPRFKAGLTLAFLLCGFAALAQYPNAPNKIGLGRQTTGDGLIYRTSGQPAWTPTTALNAWLAIDTTTGNVWTYREGEWFLEVAGDLKVNYPKVINKSGVNILRGQVVMVDTSLLVQGDQVRILPAIATISNSQFVMGVATEDIANDASGYITWFGYVREVDHADIAQTGVTLDIGDILYISATEAGKYTDTEPAAPNVNATIALVVRKPSANNMTLLVRPWLNEKLGDLRDVDLAGLQTGDGIKWDGTKWVAGQFAGADSTIVSAGYGIDVSEVSNNFTVSADTSELSTKWFAADTASGVKDWVVAQGYTSNTGTVTSIATGYGLDGGTITTSGTLSVDTLEIATPYDVSLKQDKLIGTGLVKSTSGTISYITDNSTNWDAAYNDRITSAAFSGSGTKTLTLTQQDAGTVTASFTDLQGVTSVTAGTGLSGGTITTTGTIAADTAAVLVSKSFLTNQGYTSNTGTVTSIATNNGITGGTITTTGTIGLTGQALALHNLSTNGLIARTGAGTVSARTITAGTGISISNGDGVSANPTITNSAPDQTVVLTAGTGISTSGTYPNFTITNSAPDQTVSIAAGTGISTSGSYPNFTITNSAPDQTVSIAGAGINSVSGTYPNFTVTGTEVDGSTTNEGTLGVGAGGANTAVITSNTSGAAGVTIAGGSNISVTESTSSNGGTVTIAATGLASNYIVQTRGETPSFDAGSNVQNSTVNFTDTLNFVFFGLQAAEVYTEYSTNKTSIVGEFSNIYNANNTLTGPRLVFTDGHKLTISGTNSDAILEVNNSATGGSTTGLKAIAGGLPILGQRNTNVVGSVVPTVDLQVATSGTAAAGLGNFINFGIEDAGGLNKEAGRIGFRTSDAAGSTYSSEAFISVRKDSSELKEGFTLLSTGQVQFKEYGDTLFTGTPVKYLAVDDDGKVIEVDGAAGTIKGTGAANKLAIWASADSLYQNTNLHWDNSNARLGVGIASPQSKVDVGGDVRVSQIVSGSAVGFSDFAHANAAGLAAFPRAFFNIYGSGESNAALYVTPGNAISTQVPAFIGISTNKDVKQADSYQLISFINTSAATIFTTKAENSITGGALDIYLGGTTVASSDANLILKKGGNVGVGTTTPANRLDVEGGAAIGASYSGTNTAPTNGLIVEGSVGVGTANPTSRFTLNLNTNDPPTPLSGTVFHLNGADGLPNRLFLNSYGAAQQIDFVRANGTSTALSNVAIGNSLGGFGFRGYRTTDYYTSAFIAAAADEDWNDASAGSRVGIFVSQNGSTTVTERLRVSNNGNVGLSTSTPQNRLDVEGAVAIGATYSGTNTAPTNGLLVEGETYIGKTTDAGAYNLQVSGAILTDSITISHSAQTAKISNFYPSGANGNNLFIGNNGGAALNSTSTFSSNNIGIGFNTLNKATSGYQNTMVGSGSGQELTTGLSNTATGFEALKNVSTGQQNTGVGDKALTSLTSGSYNTAVGVGANDGTTTASNNTSMGWFALTTIISGNDNTAVGYQAGRYSNSGSNLATNSNSTFIGSDARSGSTSATNEIVIGYQGRGNGSNTTTIGNTSTTRTHILGTLVASKGAPVTRTTSTYSMTNLPAVNYVIANFAGTMTITLPTASDWVGRELTIKTVTANTVISNASNVVPIDDTTAGTAILPATDGAWAKLVSDGTNWIIMQKG